FRIGLSPTGSKDPFALRRAANAVVKILAESELKLAIDDVVYATRNLAGRSDENLLKEVKAFLVERLRFFLKDEHGFTYDIVNAVLAAETPEIDVRDTIARAEALTAMRGSEDFTAVSAAFKRMKNIVRQAYEKGFEFSQRSGQYMAAQEAEKFNEFANALIPKVAILRQQRAYGEALSLIATMRPTVDAFFDKVMVLDDNPAVRGANVVLLENVLRGFSGIADFSEIVTS
ncbi:MAG: glycine--tRNA ligase subunit beta, partial [Terracidiphilus sp.]